MFQTGLIVGELVILRSSDYDRKKKTLQKMKQRRVCLCGMFYFVDGKK